MREVLTRFIYAFSHGMDNDGCEFPALLVKQLFRFGLMSKNGIFPGTNLGE